MRLRVVLVAVLALGLLAVPVSSASAYSKPAKGRWKVEDLFGDVGGGTMKVAKSRKKIKKLKIKISKPNRAACGGRTAVASGLKIKKYKQAGGRWAYARLPRKTGLFTGKRTKIRVGGKKVRGKLILLFDETGKLVSTGGLELPGGCVLDFIVRK